MSGKSHDIDALLRQNVDRQLADFDWSGLRRDIAGRVASAGVQSRPRVSYRTWATMAAELALAAGILVFAVTMTWKPKSGAMPAGWADVTMIEATGPMGTAHVSLADARPAARCEVRIIASDTRREDRVRASWCIIAAQSPAVTDRRNGRDSWDIPCLF